MLRTETGNPSAIHTLAGGLLLAGLRDGLGTEADILLLLELLLELLGVDGRRLVLGRFVCGHGRHLDVQIAGQQRAAPPSSVTSPGILRRHAVTVTTIGYHRCRGPIPHPRTADASSSLTTMSSQHPPLQPPVPFADFEFSFDPSLSNLFPNPPPLPSSADLFSASETTDIFGFLDNFNDISWGEFIPDQQQQQPSYDHVQSSIAPYSNPHLNTVPEPSTSTRPRTNTRTGPTRGTQDDRQLDFDARASSTTSESPNPSSTPTFSSNPDLNAQRAASRAKPLLSTPQKRLNHIMSEQKRRNAIRDGYAQLITLLAPAGSGTAIGMPTRGRPKGSGSRGKGQTKGKSGVLFRAVEYVRWLEEGQDALGNEVLRVEAAAGIRHPPS